MVYIIWLYGEWRGLWGGSIIGWLYNVGWCYVVVGVIMWCCYYGVLHVLCVLVLLSCVLHGTFILKRVLLSVACVLYVFCKWLGPLYCGGRYYTVDVFVGYNNRV